MTVGEIFAALCRDYPLDTACDFDNCGLLLGDKNSTVTGILVALDCTAAAMKTAIQKGCNLIVTHHPVIFHGVRSVTEETLCYRLLAAGISVICMHTNLDVGQDGVNDCLCRAIGLRNIQVVAASDGFLLRRGEIDPVSAAEFAAAVQAKLGGFVRFADGGKPVCRVLVCSGSGSEYLSEAAAQACDALLTAEVKHHLFLAAVEQGISLFDAGHLETENVVVTPLAEKLRHAFPDLAVIPYTASVIQTVKA
ncbi:MAG: Nif3-like dinuclear metal center hexameric protein [Clostridia bacterium]|nr:Nif3-like dinuclear metal center hexameric protein [Clostridia bacterium]